MEFRLLGEVEIETAAGVVRPSGRKQQGLLALLLLHNGELLSRDFLIDQLWERPPADPAHALEGQISRLRKTLRALDAGTEPIVRRAGGYVLEVEPERIDLGRAERLISEGRRARTEGDEETAVDRLTQALALWQGEPLSDLAFEPFAPVELHRLEELRLASVEELAEAQLALGRHSEVIQELDALLVRHPLRERLRGALMLALYRAGRQADALDCYRDGRERLVDELGIEPSESLQQLQHRILNHDPALTPSGGAAPRVRSPGLSAAAADVLQEEQRRVVTIVFCDLSDSTALGDELDPEALRKLLKRYFDRIRSIVERNGGTVEKFIGDAVMAVFGVPHLHEDDALRACRAALEMQESLPSLGLTGRIGVATGEVVTGTEERLATGAAVNLAARLEQAAQPGAILIAGETLRLAGAAEVEPVEPLELKGKAEPVRAYRLLSISEAPRRSDESPFVGRGRELDLVREAWRRASSQQRCELVTIVGDPGIGKSRLVAEAVASLEARVVSARCLPYGDGITYWPVVEAVKQLHARPADPAARAALASLLGETAEAASGEEIAWAFRKLLEQEAPLVLVLDDIQWGEQAFLDLVDQIGVLSSDAAILLLCVARPELVDRRPQWPVALRLEPLADAEVDELIGDRAPETLRNRIAQAAGGNPLFVLEMLAIADQGDADVVVPPTLRALLAARLDRLDHAERRVLECGAVEGELFHRGAVQALASQEQVTPRLVSLTRKGLIRLDRAQIAGEDAFRFGHLLIRDAAYDALPKGRRARLHERLADWLEERAADLIELDEIVGYHLEQASRYQRELGEPAPLLAERAGDRLAVAGRRAHLLGDVAAAVRLLGRARALLPVETRDVALEIELAEALLWAGRPAEAESVLDQAESRAAARGERPAQLLARLARAGISWSRGSTGSSVEQAELAREAIPEFEATGDEPGLMRAWVAIAHREHMRCRFAARNQAFERALVHARWAGDFRSVADITTQVAAGYVFGPEPVEEGLRRLEAQQALLARRPMLIGFRAVLEAMRGRFDDAHALLSEALARNEELGAHGPNAVQAESAWTVETYADDPAAAERALRSGCRRLEEMGEQYFLSTQAAELANTLVALGRHDEAAKWARKSRKLAAPDDAFTQMLWRQALATVAAHRGELARAERLARDAVRVGEQTDMLTATGDALMDLAAVLRLADKPRDAAAQGKLALELYERKGNAVMAARARRLCRDLERSLVGCDASDSAPAT